MKMMTGRRRNRPLQTRTILRRRRRKGQTRISPKIFSRLDKKDDKDGDDGAGKKKKTEKQQMSNSLQRIVKSPTKKTVQEVIDFTQEEVERMIPMMEEVQSHGKRGWLLGDDMDELTRNNTDLRMVDSTLKGIPPGLLRRKRHGDYQANTELKRLTCQVLYDMEGDGLGADFQQRS